MGIEREKKISSRDENAFSFAGFRTFSLVSAVGFLAWMLTPNNELLSALLIVLVAIFVALSMRNRYKKTDKLWITTEVSLIITIMLGYFVAQWEIFLSVAVGILTLTILSLDTYIHSMVKKINSKEILDTLKFGIISCIILPLLPRETFSYQGIDLFNAYETWLMVVFVSGIWFVGYVLTKIIGTKKWVWLTWMIGGLVSSTAVTTSLSQLSKKAKDMNPFVFGILISSLIMFVRVAIEVFAFNKELFRQLLLPLGSIIISGIVIVWFYFFRAGENELPSKEETIKVDSPFKIKPALFFGWFFALVVVVSELALHFFWEKSLYIVSFFSGLADVDAITLSIAKLESISVQTATIAIIIASLTNTLVKWWITYLFGHKRLAKHIMISFGILVVVGIVSVFFV